MNIKKCWLIGWLVVCLLCINIPVYAETKETSPKEDLQLYAVGAVLMDGDSGRVLYEKNGYSPMPMASTTKIMTCIVALENGSLEDVVTVSSNASRQPKVHLGMIKEEHYKLKDLLYSLMLESHNDSAVAIAEHIGGSVEEFARMMNQKARDLGCFDTWFITPNGLDSSQKVIDSEGNPGEKVHSTTPANLARIMKYCISESEKKEEFLEITRTASHSFTNLVELDSGEGTGAEGKGYRSGPRNFACHNHNAFLQMMDGALSGKTGFTNDAGYCYVGALEQNGKTFIVALLACGWPNNKTYKWSDTKKLMNYGLNHYEYQNVWKKAVFEPIPVEDGIPVNENLKDTAYTRAALSNVGENPSLEVLLRDGEQVRMEQKVVKELKAPVEKGTVVGSVQYVLHHEVIGVYPVVTKDRVEKITFSWCFRKVLDTFLSFKAIC